MTLLYVRQLTHVLKRAFKVLLWRILEECSVGIGHVKRLMLKFERVYFMEDFSSKEASDIIGPLNKPWNEIHWYFAFVNSKLKLVWARCWCHSLTYYSNNVFLYLWLGDVWEPLSLILQADVCRVVVRAYLEEPRDRVDRCKDLNIWNWHSR